MYIERDGARLFFTTMGSGPDVVLLHPTPVHHAFWLPIAERLATHYRLILMDLRGHGQSTAGIGPIKMRKLAEDVHAVLQAADVTCAAFIGCSIGGYLLYEYWRRFSEHVTALAPICGKPQSDTAESREKRREWMYSARQPGGLKRNLDLMAETLIGPTARQRHPEIRETTREMMGAVSLDGMIAVQQGLMERPDSVPTLKTITVPVCAIAGGEDEVNLAADIHVVAEQVSGAEFHLLADAGHYAPLEQPAAIAEILGDFLNRHNQQTSARPAAKTTIGPTH